MSQSSDPFVQGILEGKFSFEPPRLDAKQFVATSKTVNFPNVSIHEVIKMKQKFEYKVEHYSSVEIQTEDANGKVTSQVTHAHSIFNLYLAAAAIKGWTLHSFTSGDGGIIAVLQREIEEPIHSKEQEPKDNGRVQVPDPIEDRSTGTGEEVAAGVGGGNGVGDDAAGGDSGGEDRRKARGRGGRSKPG